MKTWSLIQKFTLLGALLALIVVIAAVVMFTNMRLMESVSEEVSERTIPVLDKAHQLKLAVVQVQQWLTDISATRGLDGLNDGFDEAEANAVKARALLEELQRLDTAHAQNYRDMAAAFEGYYATGKQMAQAYVAEGPAGGNVLMGQFDKAAETLSSRLDPFVEQAQRSSAERLGEQDRAIDQMMSWVAISVLTLAGIGVFAFMVIKRALAPLPSLVAVMDRIAGGDLSGEPVAHTCGDEIGKLAMALNTMLANLREIVGGVTSAADGVVSTAHALAQASGQVREGSLRQQVDMEQVAAAMNEMSSTVAGVADNATNAARSATRANEETRLGMAAVNNVSHKLEALAEEVQRVSVAIDQLGHESEAIGGILDVIRGIAEQTNLLALNAAIEAARAGDQGRGFAVVADEVRTLASRTQSSTEEIHAMIARLQEQARNAAQVMSRSREQANETVEESGVAIGRLEAISRAVAEIDEMNGEIASIADAQAQAAGDMNGRLASISSAAQEAADAMEHNTRQTLGLEQEAERLNALASRFTV